MPSHCTRRQFLICCGKAAAIAAVPVTIAGCSGAGMLVSTSMHNHRIALNHDMVLQRLRRYGVLHVRVDRLQYPVVLRQDGRGALLALWPQCTHKGCEVRTLPDGFQVSLPRLRVCDRWSCA